MWRFFSRGGEWAWLLLQTVSGDSLVMTWWPQTPGVYHVRLQSLIAWRQNSWQRPLCPHCASRGLLGWKGMKERLYNQLKTCSRLCSPYEIKHLFFISLLPALLIKDSNRTVYINSSVLSLPINLTPKSWRATSLRAEGLLQNPGSVGTVKKGCKVVMYAFHFQKKLTHIVTNLNTSSVLDKPS